MLHLLNVNIMYAVLTSDNATRNISLLYLLTKFTFPFDNWHGEQNNNYDSFSFK